MSTLFWSEGKNTGVGSHSLLQGIFQTLGYNAGLLNCNQERTKQKPCPPKFYVLMGDTNKWKLSREIFLLLWGDQRMPSKQFFLRLGRSGVQIKLAHQNNPEMRLLQSKSYHLGRHSHPSYSFVQSTNGIMSFKKKRLLCLEMESCLCPVCSSSVDLESSPVLDPKGVGDLHSS